MQKQKTSSPKFSERQMEVISQMAHLGGLLIALNTTPVPMTVVARQCPIDDSSPIEKVWHVPAGVCGFAWVNIKPASSQFAKYMVKTGKATKDSYYGGVTMWVHEFGQSMTLKEAYAFEYAKVLRENGITAAAQSRID